MKDMMRMTMMINFSLKIVPLWDNVESYCRAVQDTYDNMAQAHCMPDPKVYTLTIRNTFCSSTTAMVARTRLNVTSPVLFKSCYKFIHSFCRLSKWMSIPLNRLLRLLSSIFYLLCTQAVCTDWHSIYRRLLLRICIEYENTTWLVSPVHARTLKLQQNHVEVSIRK